MNQIIVGRWFHIGVNDCSKSNFQWDKKLFKSHENCREYKKQIEGIYVY